MGVNRRDFLKMTTAAGAGGMAALAGCSGSKSDGSGGGSDNAGDKLPTYSYLNNPANYNPARHDAINLVGDQLKKVGLNTNVQVFEWGTLYTKITEEFNYSFATWSRGLGIDPGRRMPEQFHSSNTGKGQGNFTGYTNKDLDPKLMKQLQIKDEQKRIDMLFDIQETLNEDVPMHPIVQMPNIVAYNSDQVSGWTDHIAGYFHFESMTSVEVNNSKKELRGSWAETLGTLSVLGYNNETKLIHQFEMLYDKLVRINSKLEADPELSLATEWERPDTKTVKYKIRKGHKWHDGKSLTPDDVKFTLDYIKKHEIPLYATQWEMYDTVSVDGQWVTVKFKDPVGPVHKLFSNQIPIIPKHKWESRSKPAKATIKEPVGSGPLQFDYWDKGSELSLKKFDAHWHPVKFNRRIWRIIPESSTVWSLLKKGTLNYLPYTRIGKQLNDNQDESNIGVKSAPGDGWWHFSQNTRKKGLDDKAVRQAAVNAIPKKAINQQILYGFATEGWNLVGESFGKFSNPDVKKYQPADGVKAGKKTLKDAGYVFDGDGMAHFPKSKSE
ncbi:MULTISPECIES: ABC transporter substrate-binding protein [unclassified Haladaptatus]|uniref:ABC transporter substrate-binding protein n=1 Tax=unclassified Haladaptatus TaxID=2622732 RepID=UPI0021120969|nr:MULTISPECIES: ABC transporter substrate-binding protein [unclassified Haladaptatus]